MSKNRTLTLNHEAGKSSRRNSLRKSLANIGTSLQSGGGRTDSLAAFHNHNQLTNHLSKQEKLLIQKYAQAVPKSNSTVMKVPTLNYDEHVNEDNAKTQSVSTLTSYNNNLSVVNNTTGVILSKLATKRLIENVSNNNSFKEMSLEGEHNNSNKIGQMSSKINENASSNVSSKLSLFKKSVSYFVCSLIHLMHTIILNH